MIPKVSAALSRLLRPIRAVPRPNGPTTSKESSDSLESESYQLPPDSPQQGEPEKQETRSEKPEKTGSIEVPPALRKVTAIPATPDETESKTQKTKREIGIGALLLKLRKSETTVHSKTATDEYESGTKTQKSGARLPKGSMYDRKAS